MPVGVSADHLGLILAGAVRYALGRRSSAVGDTCDMVRAYIAFLPPNWANVVKSDVREALAAAEASNTTVGQHCDHQAWQQLVDRLDELIELESDPRDLGGDIAGPGGPHDEAAVVIDTRKSVLLDAVDVAMMDNPSDRRRFASMVLGGRVNRSPDRTRVLYLLDPDGAAAIVTELAGLATREGGRYAAEFQRFVDQRLGRMP